jgi:hypothetical protein
LFVVKEVAVKGEFVLLIFQRERERERDHGWTSSSSTISFLYVIINFRYCTNLSGRLELCQKDSSFFFPHFGKEYILLLLLLVPLLGSIYFFFEGAYCSRRDDDLMIFCCLICRLGLLQVSNKTER